MKLNLIKLRCFDPQNPHYFSQHFKLAAIFPTSTNSVFSRTLRKHVLLNFHVKSGGTWLFCGTKIPGPRRSFARGFDILILSLRFNTHAHHPSQAGTVNRLVHSSNYLCKAECWALLTRVKLLPGSQVLVHRSLPYFFKRNLVKKESFWYHAESSEGVQPL